MSRSRVNGSTWTVLGVSGFLVSLLLFWPLLLVLLILLLASGLTNTVRRHVQRISGRILPSQMKARRWVISKAEEVSRMRAVAGVAGVALVVVPTLFAVFPSWGKWDLLRKLAVLLVWLLAAVIVVVRTIRFEESGPEFSGEVKAVLERERHPRTLVLRKALRAVLDAPASGLPAGHHPQVFLPDAPRKPKRLLPWWDPLLVGPEGGWRIDSNTPQAVTGAAWATNSYVFAKDAAVSDATYGLTEEQQQQYKRLTGVSATPIRDVRGRPVGVLTVSTEVVPPLVSDAEFVKRQIELAVEVAPLLIELGGVTSSSYT